MTDTLAIGKVIKMPCMRSGLCKYTNETVLVSKAALDQMRQSAVGIPVIIDHPDVPVTADSIKDMPVVGRVADLHWIEEEGYWIAHFIVDSQEAVDLLSQGYGVSTAWYGEEYAGAGTYNNVPYDRELVSGRYEHLAIVANPRYEMAVGPIFLNSKSGHNDPGADTIINDSNKRGISMIGKVWKKLTQREEVMVNSNEEYVVEIDGKEMLLKDVIAIAAAHKNAVEEEKKDDDKKKLNGDDKVDVDGEEMTVNELITRYKAGKKAAKKNEDEEKDAEDKKKENTEDKDADDKGDKKENAGDTNGITGSTGEKDDADKDADESARFNALDDAHKNGVDNVDAEVWLSLHERTKLGQSRYGSKK